MFLRNHKYFHWLYHQKGGKHLFNIGFGLFVWLFLSLTLPFGLYQNNLGSHWVLALYVLPFGFLFTLLSYGWDALGLKLGMNMRGDIAKDLLGWGIKICLWVHTIYLLRSAMCDWQCIDVWEYLELWLAGGVMFTLFYIPFSLYARSGYLKSMVEKPAEVPKRENELELWGDGKSSIRVQEDQIIFIQADDNYVDIHLAKPGGQLKKEVLRATLKSLESQLESHPEFLRVHRSFLINVKYLSAIPRKDQLILESGTENFEIPVSRKYQEVVAALRS